jgi:hypothetical protein
LVATADGRWRATAVGDSCLFQLRRGRLMAAFPLSCSSAFGSSPYLIGSMPSANRELKEHIHSACGRWLPGDRFLLMTDAVARCFLCAREERHSLRLPDAAKFPDWVESLRRQGRMRNDDVTVLVVDVA